MALPGFSPRLAFGCCSGVAGLKLVARNFTAPCFWLSLRHGRTEIHCPKLQRGNTSVHGFDAAATRALSGFSPRLAFGCQPCAAGQKIIARNFTAPCFWLSLRRSRTETRCPKLHRALLSVVASVRPDRKLLPETSTRHYFGARICRGSRPGVARFFTAALLRLSLRHGRTENYCPKLHRALLSVVSHARPDRELLPETSPRLAFGCRFGAAGLKLVARNFNAAFLRCMDLTRQTPGHCPLFHRACFRLSAMRSRTEIHCPKFLRGRHRLNIIQPCGRKFIFLLFLFRFAFNNQ